MLRYVDIQEPAYEESIPKADVIKPTSSAMTGDMDMYHSAGLAGSTDEQGSPHSTGLSSYSAELGACCAKHSVSELLRSSPQGMDVELEEIMARGSSLIPVRTTMRIAIPHS